MQKRRVLVIGHTYVAPVNRLKLDHMAKDERFEFMLAAPRRWRDDFTRADVSARPQPGAYASRFLEAHFVRHPALYLLAGLHRVVREFRPDLIYCEQEPICLVSLQAVCLAASRPVLFYSWENIDRRDVAYRCLSGVRAVCLRRADLMVAGSREVASVLRKHGYRRSIYVSPLLGVAPNLFRPPSDGAAADRREPGPALIGFIGRFSAEKDVPTLLRAIAQLDSALNWRLVLLGGGPEADSYVRLSQQMRIGDRLELRSSIPHDAVPEVLRSFDLLVLPSRTTATWKEQFGHVLVEAMACGVPVIGSSSGGIPAVIGEAGLVFREGDARDLAGKIASVLLDKTLRADMRRKGLRRVAERYSDERIAQNTLAVCEIALGMERITENTLEVAP